jgi:DNA-directed RNA polymerase subunit K
MVLEKLGDKFTRYEIARILGARALQLAMDAPVLLKLNKEQLEAVNYDVLKIAEMELESGVLPITVKRPFPKKTEERVKKIDKEQLKKIEEKQASDAKVEQQEDVEEKDIEEEGEIMELAMPDDEVEKDEGDKSEEGI